MCQQGGCSPKGVDTRWCASKDAGARRRVDLVRVPHRFDKGTSDSEDAALEEGLKNLEGKWKGKTQKEQYQLVVGLRPIRWRIPSVFEDININCVRIPKKKKKKKKEWLEKGARITTTPQKSHTFALYVAPDAKNTPTNFSCTSHNPSEKKNNMIQRENEGEEDRRRYSVDKVM